MATDIVAPVDFDIESSSNSSELKTAAQSMRYRAAVFAVNRSRFSTIIESYQNDQFSMSESQTTEIIDQLDSAWLLVNNTIDDTMPQKPENLLRAIKDRQKFDQENAQFSKKVTVNACAFEREWSIYGNNAGVEPYLEIVQDTIRCIQRLNADGEPPWRQYIWSNDLEKYIWPTIETEREYDTTEVGVMLTLLGRIGLMGIKQRSNRKQFWFGQNIESLEMLAEYIDRRQSIDFELPLGDSSLRFG